MLALAGDSDPVKMITERARDVVIKAIQDGWSGPPYDPFGLADYLKIAVVARQDIPEARTVPSRTGFTIEFNPNRPRSRVKYSICHELAHTLFPDCGERVRHRITHRDTKGDEWQLEALCNIGAAELLMPVGSVAWVENERLTIDAILETRKQHQISAEAVLLRAARLTTGQCCAFSASRRNSPGSGERYFIDYAVGSRAWTGDIKAGIILPEATVARECTAIGFTAKGHEQWETLGTVRVECLGVPPYPRQIYPRVLGIIRRQRQVSVEVAGITNIQGDASRPRGSGSRILAQIVNDRAFTWGGGFSLTVRKKWPEAQKAFRAWAEPPHRNLRLGRVHVVGAEDHLAVASLVAQHGFHASPKPRIRYLALKSCLEELSMIALQRHATVHMPKIGSGLAGGSWSIVRELVQETLCRRGVKVFVYELPGGPGPAHPQKSLDFS